MMFNRFQTSKSKSLSSNESAAGSRGRKLRKLPPVVLKGYLTPKETHGADNHQVKNGDQNFKDEAAPNEENGHVPKCSECDATFDQWSDLYNHFKIAHPTSDYGNDNGEEQDRTHETDNDEDAVPPSGHPDIPARNESPGDSNSKIRTTWCHICKKHLATVSSRNLHMRIHTGERPFVCPFCNKSFTQNVHLRSHMSVHTGAKPYVCDVCGKGFVASRTLKIHMMSHTRDIPHTCRHCSRKFLLRNHLLLHMQTHHADQSSSAKPPIAVSSSGRSPESTSSTVASKSSSRKFHLHPPQHLVFNTPATEDDDMEQEDGSINGFSVDQMDHGQLVVDGVVVKCEDDDFEDADQKQRIDNHSDQQQYNRWPLSSPMPVTCSPVKDAHSLPNEIFSMVGRSASSNRTPSINSRTNKYNSKHLPEFRKAPMPSTEPAHQPRQNCPNCAIVESELQLLKTELGVIKQFLGNKLTLMEQKIDNIQVLIK